MALSLMELVVKYKAGTMTDADLEESGYMMHQVEAFAEVEVDESGNYKNIENKVFENIENIDLENINIVLENKVLENFENKVLENKVHEIKNFKKSI